MKLAIIAGGIGAAKLLEGLARVHEPADITVIVNVGDDTEMHGLYICPDFDMIAYTLAGAAKSMGFTLYLSYLVERHG